MNVYDILASAAISAVVSAVTAFLVVRFTLQNASLSPKEQARKVQIQSPFRKLASEARHQFSRPASRQPRENREGNQKVKEPEGNNEHNAVLRKVASDMKSQLKGYQDFISRDPQPLKIPEISNMPLWKDLVDNHLPKDSSELLGKWHLYLENLREHAEYEAQLFVDLESEIRNQLQPYSFLQNKTLTDIPPEKTVFYTVEFMGALINNWLSKIRGIEPKYTAKNDFLISNIDAKRTLKESGFRFLILGNNRIACGPIEIIEEVQEKFRDFLVNFAETELFRIYSEKISSNEMVIESEGSKLKEMLSSLENANGFRGECRYIK